MKTLNGSKEGFVACKVLYTLLNKQLGKNKVGKLKVSRSMHGRDHWGTLEVRPSSVAPDPAESRGAPPPPQDPSPLRGTLGSSLRSPAEGEGNEGFPPPPDKDLESPSSTRLEALVPSRDSRARTRSPSPHGQASKRIHLGTKWQLRNEEHSQPLHTLLAQRPAASLQSSPQRHPSVLTQGTSKTQTSPSLSPKPISLSSPCMRTFSRYRGWEHSPT